MIATLTRDSVLSMPAGREMDVLMAERVMGWTVKDDCYYSNGEITPWMTPEHWGDYQGFRPSTDIAAAWEVMEKLCDLYQGLGKMFLHQHPDGWEAGSCDLEVNSGEWLVEESATGSTPMLAICRAALLMTLGDV